MADKRKRIWQNGLMTTSGSKTKATDYDPTYYREWISPNKVSHLVNRRTGNCITCGKFHEVTK